MGSVSDFPHVCDKIPTKSTSDRRALLWLRVYPEGEGMASGVEVTVISVIRRQRMDRKRNGVAKCQALPQCFTSSFKSPHHNGSTTLQNSTPLAGQQVFKEKILREIFHLQLLMKRKPAICSKSHNGKLRLEERSLTPPCLVLR